MRIDLPNIIGSGEVYLKIMNIICGDTSNLSMVDLMCHKAPYTSQLWFKERTYVDVLDRGLDDKNEQQYFVHYNVFDFFNNNSKIFDVAICSDGIEHLTTDEGYDFIAQMEQCSGKQIIFTPLGEVMMNVYLDNHFDTHKSGWEPSMFQNYLSISFPNFHPELNSGAFFAVKCNSEEKIRIQNEITKLWTKYV